MKNDPMKLSGVMRLCGHDITVKIEAPGSWATNGMGRANERLAEILIANDCAPSAAHSTLLHEMIHLILDINGLHDLSQNETAVSVLSSSLLAWMRDNPDLVAKLSKPSGA
jgi:hypothetical protein